MRIRFPRPRKALHGYALFAESAAENILNCLGQGNDESCDDNSNTAPQNRRQNNK
jgi:hypothetical protein